MVGDHSPQASQDGPGRDDDTPAADRGGEHQRQPLSSSPVQAGDVSLPAPDRDNAAPARASSMFGAPDYSWRELDLSAAGGWREAPLWPGAAPRGEHPVPPGESAEQAPAAMPSEGVPSPNAPEHAEPAPVVLGDAAFPAPHDPVVDQVRGRDVAPAGAESPPEPEPDGNPS